jgi:hypothetical protein
VKVYVPGGRWGNYEQRVGGLETPQAGATVGLSREAGKEAWIRLETLADANARDAFFRAHAAKAQVAVK